ncbi:hypothetical protein COT75_02705 [Candidatus Beckwithbacteria bacterium CG10_big_fil_rev_8_21_14_0_10_34_10]|uniref:Serine aminopeptidase S33 domain-containing protein n=1 Tax=Candidatus Beckwithbacteria bacterium CG10_big_fil_rev_8_21_14_0_10_34_10 TaxID=1974495 RepID=A0A2H0W912_9BACT|nr:MAG: hypothetical protein COT75_02705 [Candidatus Beckwithbacteria bacterium CG10_big_fil_rev_8_21_14_0_10_34_10]
MSKNIVILHGWASKLQRWESIKKKFEEKGLRVFLPSLPGFSKEEIVKAYNLDDYISWLKNYLKEKKIKDFYLLGHSFGGSLGIKYAALKNKDLKGLILVNSAGIRKKLTFKKLIFLIIAKSGKALFYLPPFCFFSKLAQKALYLVAREKDYFLASKIMKKTMKKILKEDLTGKLQKIKAPVLIIWGRKDKVTPLKDGLMMKKAIPNSKLLVYNNSGHSLPFKKSQCFTKDILDFINNG